MKTKKYLKTAVMAIGASVMLSSCATLINGTTQKMAFNSEPSGAQVTGTTGEVLCSGTPCEVFIPRSPKTMILKFTKKGYGDSFAPVIAGVSGWYFLDCLLLVPALVDLISGAAYYYPEHVFTTMQSTGRSSGNDDDDGEAVEMP
jgi:hypothetical protein